MSAITAKASRKMKKYAVLTREPRCFLGSFDFSWEQRKAIDIADYSKGNGYSKGDLTDAGTPIILYGRLYTKYQFAISEVDTFAVPRNGAVYSQGNEVIVPASGETAEDIARASAVEKSGVLLGGDLNILRPFDFINPLFLALAISNGEPQKELAKKAQGKSVVHIHNTDIQEVTIAYPSRTEQDRIVSVFRQLDHLITLHQRKCVFLFGFFQAFISMIFTASTFSWEQRKLSELTSMHARIGWQNLRTSEFLDSGNYMLITGTDFNDGAINFSTCHYVERERYEQDRNIQIHNGSILITKDGTLGKVAYVQGLSMPATLNAGVFNVQIKDANNVDEKYLFQYLKAPFLMDYVDKKATGGTIKHLNQSILVDFPVILPQRSEQTLIGAFFQQLDNLITLHQRECISFTARAGRLILTANKKRNTSSWEQRKFDEVFDCTVPNNTLSRAELSYDEGTVLNVHYGDVLIKYGSVLDVQKDDIPRIPHRCREDFNGALLQDGDVIIADTAEDETTGKACEIGNLQGSAIVSGLHTMVCRPRNRMALGYLGYYLNSNAYHYQLLPLMQGIKVLSLSRSNIQKTSVSYPIAVKEQQLIAYYFSQLDNLITLHQRKPFLMKWRTSDANRNQTNRLVL